MQGCMHVYTHACTYLCMHVCMYVCRYTRTQKFARISLTIYQGISMLYLLLCGKVSACACYVCNQVCVPCIHTRTRDVSHAPCHDWHSCKELDVTKRNRNAACELMHEAPTSRYVKQFAFEFTRVEIERVVFERVLQMPFRRFDVYVTETCAKTALQNAFMDHLRFSGGVHSKAIWCTKHLAAESYIT